MTSESGTSIRRTCLTKVLPLTDYPRLLSEVIRRSLIKQLSEHFRSLDQEPSLENLGMPQLAILIAQRKRDGFEELFQLIQTPDTLEGKILRHPSDDSWYGDMMRRKQESLKQLYGSASFQLIDANEEIASKISEAEEFLCQTEPALFEIYTHCVSHLFLAKSQDLVSFSIPQALGAIVVAPQANWTIPHFVEAIVHESTHVELTMRQQIDPFLQNRMQLSVNPLRKDPRPLDGTFHAALVMLRVCIALQSMPPSQDRNHILFDYLTKLPLALAQVSEHAQFTSLGQALFEDMQRSFENLKSTALPVLGFESPVERVIS